jgi:hypothetical protein
MTKGTAAFQRIAAIPTIGRTVEGDRLFAPSTCPHQTSLTVRLITGITNLRHFVIANTGCASAGSWNIH